MVVHSKKVFSVVLLATFVCLFQSTSGLKGDAALKADTSDSNDVIDNHQVVDAMKKENSRLSSTERMLPTIINTWWFTNATKKAWEVVLQKNGTALDAVEQGCAVCEQEQCDGTVGYGGSPDENGETTLDAMIMDGPTHQAGSVAGLKRIKNAIGVARKVMEHTEHTLLVGEAATQFALQMGFKEETLSTNDSNQIWESWKNTSCQPNFWKDVYPDPRKNCGPYSPFPQETEQSVPFNKQKNQPKTHDTIGMVALDANGNLASGTSTNGARHKIPGRVGDSPIIGSGSYVDQQVGGAAATGDGDILMRFLPSFAAVEHMRNGMTPKTAATYSLKRIARFYPDFSGAIVTLNLNGEFGAACHGFKKFAFSVANPDLKAPRVYTVPCTLPSEERRRTEE